jgi:ankyrin repeat protein
MATVSRGLPEQPHLDVPKRESRELLDLWREQRPDALARIQRRHPKFKNATVATIAASDFKLADAQWVVAQEYGFSNWAELKHRIESNDSSRALLLAIHMNDFAIVRTMLRARPALLHIPVRSGNWGPPMSHAANLGHLDIIKACAELGARDYHHAFGRALLQGKLESARWLHAHGAKLAPGLVMGTCETLNVDGFKFLLELGAPLTDKHGNRLAPLGLVLETYGREPAGKHAILELFAQHGYELPDTPAMALHRGDIPRLEAYLRSDPRLLEKRFTLREIYPLECGCSVKGGMHWTPIDGTTLLHLAIDFNEPRIFEWLLTRGADVNTTATVDAEGFGGHTPIFNAVVCGQADDPVMMRGLLQHGASTNVRASLRKFIDWVEKPGWHEARNVTAAEWARGFPERGWVNQAALKLLG